MSQNDAMQPHNASLAEGALSYQTQVEEINFTRRKIRLAVPKTSVKSAMDAEATKLQEKATLKGFRPGKAPLVLVHKFYEQDIREKAAQKIVQDAFENITRSFDFQIISEPHITPENNFSAEEDFRFTAEVDVNPHVTIVDYSGIPIKAPKAMTFNEEEARAEFLEKAWAQVQREKADQELPAFDNKELTDDVAKLLGYEDALKANEAIRGQVKSIHNGALVRVALPQIIKHILAHNTFEIASSLVNRTMKQMLNAPEMAEQYNANPDAVRDEAAEQVRAYIALGHIARQENIQVSDYEVFQKASYDLLAAGVPVKNFLKNLDQNFMTEVRGNLVAHKVLTKIVELANVEYVDEPTEDVK